MAKIINSFKLLFGGSLSPVLLMEFKENIKMSFTLVPYNKLKARIKEGLVTLLKHHGLDPTTLDESLKKLPTERRIHATFLKMMMDSLDKEKPKSAEGQTTKARTLNAAAYFIWQKIYATYGFTSPEGGLLNKGSSLYISLTSSLELTTENTPNESDLADMYNDLKEHLCKNTYKDSDPRKGYLDNRTFTIDDYSVEEDIKSLGSKLLTFDSNAIKLTKETEERKQAPSASGFLGSFWGSSKTATKEEPVSSSTHTSTI